MGLFAFRPLAWVPFEIDSRVSVSMPGQPQQLEMPDPAKAWLAKGEAGVYCVITAPLGADFQGDDRKTYYNSLVENALLEGKVKLSSRSDFSIDKYQGIDFAASITTPDNQHTKYTYNRCLIVDKKSYVLQFITADGGKDGEAQSKQFFNSIALH
jgi:hypothetical protein